MVRNAWLAGVVVAVLGVGGLAFAQDSSSGMKEKSTYEKETNIPKADLRTFTLTVKDVDKAEHKVQFEAQVSPEANIMESGQPIKLDQLEEGDQVRASFDPSTGSVVKLEVIRNEPKAKPGSSETK